MELTKREHVAALAQWLNEPATAKEIGALMPLRGGTRGECECRVLDVASALLQLSGMDG
jgi:hypothetical protein